MTELYQLCEHMSSILEKNYDKIKKTIKVVYGKR